MIKQTMKDIVILSYIKIYMLGQSICRIIENRLGILGENEVKKNITVADIQLFYDFPEDNQVEKAL